jgi:hypothetical protein
MHPAPESSDPRIARQALVDEKERATRRRRFRLGNESPGKERGKIALPGGLDRGETPKLPRAATANDAAVRAHEVAHPRATETDEPVPGHGDRQGFGTGRGAGACGAGGGAAPAGGGAAGGVALTAPPLL